MLNALETTWISKPIKEMNKMAKIISSSKVIEKIDVLKERISSIDSTDRNVNYTGDAVVKILDKLAGYIENESIEIEDLFS